MPKLSAGLFDKDVQNAKPKESPYKIHDRGGLCILIRPTGTRAWQYHYTYEGLRRTLTIGKYLSKGMPGHVSLKDARIALYEAKALLDEGIDPSAHKQSTLSGKGGIDNQTFEAIGREWHSKGTWVDKHAKNILRSLEDDVFPLIGAKGIADVSSHDIIEILSRIEKRQAYDVATRVCQRCQAIFDYAITKGICNNNPAQEGSLTEKDKTGAPPMARHFVAANKVVRDLSTPWIAMNKQSGQLFQPANDDGDGWVYYGVAG